MNLSVLRILGLIAGMIVFAILARRLRSAAPQRADVWTLTLAGTSLIALSIFPDMLNLPTDIFFLGDIKGGRIISLLILAVLALFYMVVTGRSEIANLKYQFDRSIQSGLAHEFLLENAGSLSPQTILILMPAWNEAENLPKVLPRIPRTLEGRPVQALVINDGSIDGTEAIAQGLGALVISHPFNRGGGAALRTGYAVAELAGIEIIVTMDADGQHLPEEISALLLPILKNEADFVIGSRMMGSYDRYSSLRIMGVRVFNGLINALMGTKVTDCASGFRALRFSALGKISLLQDQYHTSELIIDAAKKGLRITERPIHIATRLHGYTKKGKSIVYALGFLRTVLVTWWR